MQAIGEFSAADRAQQAGVSAVLEGGSGWCTVASDSMYPYLRPGDEVKLEPLERPPRWGSVVAFVRGGRVWIHRVRGAAGPGRIWTRGDMQAEVDRPVSLEVVLGRVAAVRRRGVHTPAGVDALLGLWCVLRSAARVTWHRWRRGSCDQPGVVTLPRTGGCI